MNPPSDSAPWWRQLTGYHWFVFLVASAAWFFDCLDQRLFSLARIPALSALMHLPAGAPEVQAFGKVVTAWFLIGWGVGGMIFGALGDRYGRARMLTLTILIYSGFTGLTFLSSSRIDFTIYRFLTGVGVGGVFGLAVALIAETVPSGARAQSLGLLQVLSTVGNVMAGFCKMGIDALQTSGVIDPDRGWRWMFLIGAVPALMIIFTRSRLKEPEPWLRQKAEGKLASGGIFSSYAGLLADTRWRRNLVIGALIASTGVVGLWAIAEFAPDLQKTVFQTHYEKAGLSVADAKAKAANAISYAYLLNMLGAAAGMWIFTRMCNALGRKPSFVIGFTAALLVTAFVYWKMDSPQDAYWMMPLMGAVQLGPFAGFAIYLPELFPSRLRSTGISFCYNLGRFAAAAGSFYSSGLTKIYAKSYAAPLPYRYSAITMCSLFLIGIVVALFFAPETKGKALPEEMAGA